MSREIKFRAWNDNANTMAVQGTPDLETLSSFIFHYGDNDLMQYTGLKDRDGLEIFEGDCVALPFRNELRMVFKVIYNSSRASFECVDVLNQSNYRFSNDGVLAYKVIGNIYENPELLNE